MSKKEGRKSALNVNKFYELMRRIRDLKAKIINDIINGKVEDKQYTDNLKKDMKLLNEFTEKNIVNNIIYEVDEIARDIFFLNNGEEEMLNYLGNKNENYLKDLKNGIRYFNGKKIDVFITNREGTINNNCTRDESSVQSIYNAYYLWKFLSKVQKAIIMSSAELDILMKVNILYGTNIILAGAHGREYLENGRVKRFPFKKEEISTLNKIKREIGGLIKRGPYKKFSLLGSGLQEKLGVLTILRQDDSNSINPEDSNRLLEKIGDIVAKHNKKGMFSVEDNGLEVEIKLKREGKEFNKGDSLKNILSRQIPEKKNVLVCGDNLSDIAMIKTAKEFFGEVNVIFVTKDENIRREVEKTERNALFVSSPDALISILKNIGDSSQ